MLRAAQARRKLWQWPLPSLLPASSRMPRQKGGSRSSGDGSGRRAWLSSSTAAYDAALVDLFKVNKQLGEVKQGLNSVERLNAALGDPANKVQVIHVVRLRFWLNGERGEERAWI